MVATYASQVSELAARLAPLNAELSVIENDLARLQQATVDLRLIEAKGSADGTTLVVGRSVRVVGSVLGFGINADLADWNGTFDGLANGLGSWAARAWRARDRINAP